MFDIELSGSVTGFDIELSSGAPAVPYSWLQPQSMPVPIENEVVEY